jgi:branched-chain amino acid aminotransferase
MIWLNGELIDASQALISPFDHGLLTGDGVFETLKAYGGEPFAQTRHYWRLVHSATNLGLTPPSQELVLEALRGVLQANQLDNARVRLTLTGGIGPLGSDRGSSGQTMLVAASPLPEYKPVTTVITVSYPRNERSVLAGLKTTSYAENVVALQQARISGCTEAIFGNLAGSLCEGTGSNIFISRDGRLITPPLSSGCLAGVTRSVVIDLCEELDLGLEEVDTPLADLESCEEAFLTSTLREVQAISGVNDHELGSAPGPVAARLARAFSELTVKEMDP